MNTKKCVVCKSPLNIFDHCPDHLFTKQAEKREEDELPGYSPPFGTPGHTTSNIALGDMLGTGMPGGLDFDLNTPL